MASTNSLLGLFCVLGLLYAQRLDDTEPFENYGICKDMYCNSSSSLKRLENCSVVLGNLHVVLLDKTKKTVFKDMKFPKLREVSGFMVVYRIRGLDTLGRLFPNLARIRGTKLIDSYALIIHDISLTEIGLYSLVKIDRGGVIIWGEPHTCYVDTVDWKTIAPRSRHVLSAPDSLGQCSSRCSCSDNPSRNYCWNNKKCQRYLEGPEAVKCNKQCLGCRLTDPDACSLCRHYTHRGACVSGCPPKTIVLPEINYCLTKKECRKLDRFAWNDTCVFDCPLDYKKKNDTKTKIVTCEPCTNCQKTCGDLSIQTLTTIQMADQCVYVNGSLTIHVRAIPEAMDELRTYVSRIQEVTDYVVIYGSLTITSLDFLSSLRRIRGLKLYHDKYSLVIYDMQALQTLFIPNVRKNLKIDRGTMRMYRNPVLCKSQIDLLKDLFPDEPKENDVPQGLNGYSGGCAEVSVGLQLRVLNETTALVMFSPVGDHNVYYTILYVRLPQRSRTTIVPETCSESEWFAVNAPKTFGHEYTVELTSLRPASTYALCIEVYDPIDRHLARSDILNFTTPVGKPQPPFIIELVAASSDVVVLRWVNHKEYHAHITHYELDVTLVEIFSKDVTAKDHCTDKVNDYKGLDYFRHAVVMRPPSEYDRGCESMCGILSSLPEGALTEDEFDVCKSIDSNCNVIEADAPENTTFGNYIRTISLNISGVKTNFQVGGLAPFRDYRFRLRACTNTNCSRSARSVVRTLPSANADVASIVYTNADTTGYITVKWKPPAVTNGPILAYSLQVMPKLRLSEFSYLIPQTWCVLPDKTSLVVKSERANKYLVKICTSTLAFNSRCSDWSKVIVTKQSNSSWWWTGFIFGVVLYTTSTALGYFWRPRIDYRDNVPILEDMSFHAEESEPPAVMLSDCVPFYSIPLRDTQLNY